MKVAITGAAGMLARDLIDALATEYELLLIDRLQDCDDRGHEFACMDLVDETKVEPAISGSNVGLVFHCAAFTDVDGAEEKVQEAYQGNALATASVAAACREAGTPLVTISTDYVFDGTKKEAYLEFDQTNPQSVYGKSKLWSEHLAFQSGARVAVVRTSWLYGVGGKNFVKTIRRLCSEKDEISVVEDQRGSPTYTVDLAEALTRIGRGLISGRPYEGVWHVTNSGTCSWFEFAQEIVRLTGSKTNIKPTTTKAFGRPAPRPANSVLQNLRWETEGLPSQRHWREALQAYFAQEERQPHITD
jgi:dTDP-4-dehydrorhamnose reductase